MIDTFLKINKNLCNKCTRYLPQAQTNIFQLYNKYVIQYMNRKCSQIVVDVGGGRSCNFAKHKTFHKSTQIISIDLSKEELKYNHNVDKKIVADIMRGIPFRNEVVDLLVSRSVLEHIEKLESFIIHSRRVLKKNGYCIHVFPSKFAPFSLINQLLPENISKKLLYFLKPNPNESEEIMNAYDSSLPFKQRYIFYNTVRFIIDGVRVSHPKIFKKFVSL